jgi:hypothetical protein
LPGIVQELGAAAGAATIVGLALLSALHVSHARDVKRLREWAAPPQTVVHPVRRQVRARAIAAALVGLLVLAYGVTRLSGGHAADRGTPQAKQQKPKRKAAAVEPGDVTVAVLNGTTVPGLAARLGEQLAAAGFAKGTIDVYSDQQLAASVVQYVPGHQAEARAVGRTVGISRHEPVGAAGRALAPDATVIVIAGADKAP